MCKEYCGMEPPDVIIGGEVYKPLRLPTYRLICSTHRKADGKKLAEFQEGYCNLLKDGVPPEEIVKNWNDSQDSFWNKVYLVEEKP